MSKKSFLIGYLAIFFVLLAYLSSLISSVYEKERERPLIYDCFTFQGDFQALKTRLAIESKYIDRFIIVQPLDGSRLKEEEKRELISYYPEKAIVLSLPVLPSSLSVDLASFLKTPSFEKVLSGCSDRDILVFSKGEQLVEYKSLYKSLSAISQSTDLIFELAIPNMDPSSAISTVNAMTYNVFKKGLNQNFQKKLKIKKIKLSKRSFFFPVHPLEKEISL